MDYNQFIEKIVRLFKEKEFILCKKNNDYASKTDVFSNFKFCAKVAKISVEQVFLVFLAVKLARLQELLLSGKKPQNESIIDTLIDLSNYADLLKIYLEDEKDKDC